MQPQPVTVRAVELLVRRLKNAHSQKARDEILFRKDPGSPSARRTAERNAAAVAGAERCLLDTCSRLAAGELALVWNGGRD